MDYVNVSSPVALDFVPRKNTVQRWETTPWVEWIENAVKGKWVGITLPDDEQIIKDATSDARAAARAFDVGLAIRVVKNDDDETVTFAYQVKDKRKTRIS